MKMVKGRVIFSNKGSVKGNMPLIWQRPFWVIPGAVSFFFFFFFFFFFLFLFFFSHISQLQFLETLPFILFLNNYAY